MATTAGEKFRQALSTEKPLQIVGTVNAYVALMAEKLGYRAIYLSGAGVANASYALPDLGMTTLDNVLEDVDRITSATSLPLLVDIDTGWGNAFMIDRAIKAMIKRGAAAVHIEDQIFEKKCGHRPGKEVIPADQMVDRLSAAVDARTDSSFVIMARTDALAVEGLEKTIERVRSYAAAGADMLFAEAVTDLDQYRRLKEACGLPILANITEFGRTPLWGVDELKQQGIDMVLYPLTATRVMNKAAWEVLKHLRGYGTQKDVVDAMQTRQQMYEILDYERYESVIDQMKM